MKFLALRRFRIVAFLLVAVLMLAVLFRLFIFQYLQPSRANSNTPGYRLQTVTYCSPDNFPLQMRIYTPTNVSSNTRMPLVEMVHGGGWTTGADAPITIAQPAPLIPTTLLGLLAHGFVVSSIEYRLAPQFKFPANIEDVKCSIRYLRAHAAQYHINPDRIGLIGPSAGGHLVSLAGLAGADAGWDVGEYTDQSSAVQAVVDLFGPEYIGSGIGNNAISDPAIWGSSPNAMRLASPPLYISTTPNTDPPFLIIQGDKDHTVPPIHSLRFYGALLQAGQPAILQMVQNAEHGLAPATTGVPIIPSTSQISSMIIQFFMKYLK